MTEFGLLGEAPTGGLGQVMPNVGGFEPVDVVPEGTFDANAARLAAMAVTAVVGSLGGLFRGYRRASTVAQQEEARAELEGTLEVLQTQLRELRSRVNEQDIYIELLEANVRRKGMGKPPMDNAKREALRARANERKARAEELLEDNRRRAEARRAKRTTSAAATAGLADDDCCADHECVGEVHERCCGGSIVDEVFAARARA